MTKINIGFTGTREGMTPNQGKIIASLLECFPNCTVHHGGCIGADEEFDNLAYMNSYRRIVYPGPVKKLQGTFRTRPKNLKVMPEQEFKDRNVDIVSVCDLLLATPKEDKPQTYGGTWHTISSAEIRGKNIILILPNGTIELDHHANPRIIILQILMNKAFNP